MALLLAGERPTLASVVTNPVHVLAGLAKRIRAAHKRRSELVALLNMDESRLDDMGISRRDVLAALKAAN